jgi:hypothetical protein
MSEFVYKEGDPEAIKRAAAGELIRLMGQTIALRVPRAELPDLKRQIAGLAERSGLTPEEVAAHYSPAMGALIDPTIELGTAAAIIERQLEQQDTIERTMAQMNALLTGYSPTINNY